MFDNLLTAIKNQSNNLADNFKSKTRKLTFNVTSFKSKITNKPKTTYTVNQKEEYDYFYNDYLSPRAYSVNDNWPSMNDNMQWVPYVPPKLDEHNIVDRFIKVITINDENEVRTDILIYASVSSCFLIFQRRTDREEIRRRLAMGSEDDYYGGYERPGRKPSLQARLQSGK